MAQIKIKHQLLDSSFFIPNWPVKYLFLGTFNPKGGETVPYFYGRNRNQAWKLLSEIFQTELNPNSKVFFDKLEKLGIACMDMIQVVELDETLKEFVIGKGYSDSKIINNSVKRIYNSENIIDVIKKNPGIKVYSTWGKGLPLKNWVEEIAKIEKVNPIMKLVSPSMVARVPEGAEKYDYMISNWKNNISL